MSHFRLASILSTIILVSVIIEPAVVVGQTSDGSESAMEIEQTRAQRELDVRIRFCRQLMKDRNFAGAADMLEPLYENHSENVVIVSLLVQCYDILQLYGKSEEIIRRHLERDDDNFNFKLLYAEVIAKQGDFAQAAKAYLRAAAGIPVSNEARYQLIVRSMVTQGLNEIAIGFIDSLRIETADSGLFAIHRGTVKQRQKQYSAAAREFYSLLPDTSRVGNDAENKLLDLLVFGESEPDVESFLLAQVDLFEQPRALKILSSHYLKSGQYEKAFEFTISQDSLVGTGSRNLEKFMRSCYEHRLYDQAVRTGDYLFERHDTATVRDDVYLMYGDALAKLGRFEEAIASYDSVFVITKQRRFMADALYRIGAIYLDELNDFDSALIYFDSVETFYGVNPSYLKAVVSRPLCYVRKGELGQARTELERLLSRHIEGVYREQAQFDLALVQFYQKEVDSAQATLSKLLVDFPRGVYVNDAVRLLFIMEQARENPQLLYDYSNALLFLQKKMVDSAIVKLGYMTEAEDKTLAALALFELSGISLARSDTLEAIEYIDRLAAEFAESYFLPYGLKTKADFFSTVDGKLEQARDIYRLLLENFPNFPFISDVRQKVRELEERPGSS